MQGDTLRIAVTGGAGGIGTEVCRLLHLRGHLPISIDSRPHKKPWPTIRARVSRESAFRIMRDIVREYGALDGVVNCMGAYRVRNLNQFSWKEFEASLKMNLTGPLAIVLAWLHFQTSSRGGAIVNVSSAAALVGSRDLSYSVSKAGLIGATKSLARSLARRKVIVVAVAPGIVDSRMSRRMSISRRSGHIRKSLLGRSGSAVEIAELICLIAERRCDYLCGETICPSGGTVLR
jgi:NAD(P)-dependent dehydrogenase (short-subunit alcohol dehydrogenase family)